MNQEELLLEMKWNDKGLVPVITQDATTKEVLMLAWMNAEALKLTLETGRVTYYSRSRQELWVKGATSGNIQELVSLAADCDYDAILVLCKQSGPACHTGNRSCFFRDVSK